jgi:UDP-glucose 4-epimerase
MKLRGNPHELEVLGDGTQSKSYIHIDDCLDAFTMFLDANAWRGNADVYNIGTEEQTNVLRIAEIVSKAMELRYVTLKTTGVPGARAWPGDVKIMQLDVRKIKSLGWRPKHTSDEAVQLATNQLLQSTGQR